MAKGERQDKEHPQHNKGRSLCMRVMHVLVLWSPKHKRLSCSVDAQALALPLNLSALRDTARCFTAPMLFSRRISTETAGSRLSHTAADVPTKAPQSTFFSAETVTRGTCGRSKCTMVRIERDEGFEVPWLTHATRPYIMIADYRYKEKRGYSDASPASSPLYSLAHQS
jgi:hypothetical protein